MDKRGFESVEKMNEYMIRKWNSKVRKNDETVILGDFSAGNGEETNEILKSLNGTKYLIIGNHDRFLEDRKFDTKLFRWIRPYEEVKDNRRKVILSHYPVFCYNGQYRLDKNGNPKSVMLYGHVHDTYDERLVNSFIGQTRDSRVQGYGDETERSIPCVMINCFCMFSDYTPLTLDEWMAVDAARREKLTEIQKIRNEATI